MSTSRRKRANPAAAAADGMVLLLATSLAMNVSALWSGRRLSARRLRTDELGADLALLRQHYDGSRRMVVLTKGALRQANATLDELRRGV